MSTAELKLEMFRKLDGLSPDKLKKAYGLLTNFLNKNSKVGFWDELSEAEKSAINEGLKQLDSGQSFTYEEVRNKIRKDLKV